MYNIPAFNSNHSVIEMGDNSSTNEVLVFHNFRMEGMIYNSFCHQVASNYIFRGRGGGNKWPQIIGVNFKAKILLVRSPTTIFLGIVMKMIG